MRFFTLQHSDLIIQRFIPLRVGSVEQTRNLPQREFHLAEQQNRVQPLQGGVIVQTVTRLRQFRRLEQTDLIIVAQRPDTHAR